MWAAATLALAALIYVITENDQWAENAAACSVGAVAFAPGIVFSIMPSSRREAVLRAETALALGFAFFGVFVVKDIGIPVLLAPPTLMLATAAGWVFPGGRAKKDDKAGEEPRT